MLQANIEDSEWGLLCLGSGDARADKKKREAIKAATERRLKDDKKAKDKKAKRVDWLGEAVSLSLSLGAWITGSDGGVDDLQGSRAGRRLHQESLAHRGGGGGGDVDREDGYMKANWCTSVCFIRAIDLVVWTGPLCESLTACAITASSRLVVMRSRGDRST
jgi:hypothetical protein